VLHVLVLPDFERADRIGEFWGYPESRAFAELLIDCVEVGYSGRCSSGCFGKRTEPPARATGRTGKRRRRAILRFRADIALERNLPRSPSSATESILAG
jgi:hypothetical protein